MPLQRLKKSKIKVRDFGPIQEGCLENNGWIEISKTTIFIGNQGSGKSTIAKLISTFTWIEKALVRGDYDKKWIERKRLAISVLSSKFNKTSFINIIEEPEQNLFPTSQWQLLKSLLEFNNLIIGNKLIMTTHSPYIINYLSIAIQAGYLKEKIKSNNFLLKKLDSIVPLSSTVNSKEVSIYQLDEEKGTISKLNSYEGIPSDKNLLNESLADGNSLFDSLLEIEQEL